MLQVFDSINIMYAVLHSDSINISDIKVCFGWNIALHGEEGKMLKLNFWNCPTSQTDTALVPYLLDYSISI
jgi:hypothetical protein